MKVEFSDFIELRMQWYVVCLTEGAWFTRIASAEERAYGDFAMFLIDCLLSCGALSAFVAIVVAIRPERRRHPY